uniref:CUB domain-containing protein n=1 Tax=Panagrellus redivivus TaxID=6233 RepID=A0A7E4VTQ2_PANRE
MHTSTILSSVFALFFTSLLSQGNLACVNVKQNESGSTSIRLRGSGQTCRQFPLVVPKTGFQFKVYIPHKSTDTFLGSLRVYFGDSALLLTFENDGSVLAVHTIYVNITKLIITIYSLEDDTWLGDATLDITTIEIKPDGTGFVTPRKPAAASVKIPPLVEFQHNENEVTINLKIEWTNIKDEFIIELPSYANKKSSAPPKSTTSTPTSTKTIEYSENNETTTTSAILTSTAHENSTATSNVSWIVVGAAVGSVFVIVVMAAVIGAVFIIRRIRRKRSATGLLQTPPTRVTYVSTHSHFDHT